MDRASAKELLLLHSCGHPDTGHPTGSSGFIGSLRPYRGLNEENLHEVMAAIVALAPEIAHQPYVDREIVDALWSLSCTTRNWGLNPNGVLRRNGLISGDDLARLEQWIDAIEWAVTMLLGAAPDSPLRDVIDECLVSYRQVTGRDFPPGL